MKSLLDTVEPDIQKIISRIYKTMLRDATMKLRRMAANAISVKSNALEGEK